MFIWKIIDLYAENKIIISAKYSVCCKDESNSVITEGNCNFEIGEINTPFEEVTENQVIDWIKKETTIDGKNSIELMLQKQLEALKIQEPVKAPWVKTTFKPTL